MLDLTDRKHCFYWQTDRILSGALYVTHFLKRHDIPVAELKRVLRGKRVEIIAPDAGMNKGNVNIVRKVIIDGNSFVARIHPPGIKNGYFYVEKVALDECAKKQIPAPIVKEIHEAVDERDMDYMLMTVMPGTNMHVYLETDKSAEHTLLFDAGVQMAKIHEISVEKFGSFDNAIAKEKNKLVGLHDNYHDFIWTGLLENLDRLIHFQILDESQKEKIQKVFETHNFEPLDGPRLIQNDMADWNVLTDGDKLTAVLDWDECHAGDPIADIACWSTFYSIDRLIHFLKGYTSIHALPADYDQRFHFYRLRYTVSKMALRCKRYDVDPSEFVREKIEIGKQALIEELAIWSTSS